MINKRNQFSNINSTACNIAYQTRLGSGSCSAWPRLRPNTKFTLSKQHPSPPTTNHKICPSRRVTFYTHHSGSCQASLRHANKRQPGLQIKTCPICRINTSAHHNKSFLPQGGNFLPPNLPFVSSSMRCKTNISVSAF